MARRVGSPRAWNTRSISGFFLGIASTGAELLGQSFKQLAPALFTHFGTVGAFEECSLVREDEVGAGARWHELESGQRRRDALLTQAHRRGQDHAAVGHNVLLNAVVR